MSAPTRPVRLFATGQVVATRGALEGVPWDRLSASLIRHISGDFGCVDPEDAALNRLAIEEGSRILSAYPIDPSKPSKGFGSNTLWIITEADRSVTTFLLPDEY